MILPATNNWFIAAKIKLPIQLNIILYKAIVHCCLTMLVRQKQQLQAGILPAMMRKAKTLNLCRYRAIEISRKIPVVCKERQ